ncbi:MAG TPA: VWA domain-containing protein [Blastocatellia bacterium]|nr:VWA domain-containing protein [Blastocatellia bacterium]
MTLIRISRPRRAISVLLLLLAGAGASHFVLGQSGRNSQSDKSDKRPPARVKPVPPPPLQGGVPDSKQKPDPDSGQETLRIHSDLVTVVAAVAPPKGVTGRLGRDDFEIFEDGVKQEVSDFARDADVELRMVMLYDTSSSVATRIGFERRAAAKFFERVMRPQDQAALFSVATDVVVLQDFTSRVSLLTKATKQLRAKGATSLYDAIYLASDYLKPSKGRHVIVIVSDGGDTTSGKDLKEALAAAQQADAVIYAIFTGNLSPSLNVQDLAAERALATLTTETGGEVYRPKLNPEASDEQIDDQSIRELDSVFERLADQLRTQYTLGFYSSNEARDGKFRKLTVKVKKPGYAVRARSGYYAPKG